MSTGRVSANKVKLTRREFEIICDHAKEVSSWEYDTFSGNWMVDLDWFGYRIRMVFKDKRIEWEEIRECYMKPACRRALSYETPVREVCGMCNIGHWTYDISRRMLKKEKTNYEA